MYTFCNKSILLQILLCLYFIKIKATLQNSTESRDKVRVNKCCEKFEILVDLTCTKINKSQSDIWQPTFSGYDGKQNIEKNFKFVVGIPACGSMQTWPIYYYNDGPDKLILLEDGKLRHYTNTFSEESEDSINSNREPLCYDYDSGQYCLEKAITENGEQKEFMFAMVCLPEKKIPWTDTDFILRKLINPILHCLAIIFLLAVSVIYFILPTLRDLVGNIITTMSLCLTVYQITNLVKMFTEFSNHVSFLVADTILYISLLGAFFWINCLGYYIWKTFRSRNVFLRVTDRRKYCWYSSFVWGSVGIFVALAIFSHYFLDSSFYRKQNIIENQETLGWLGITIFFLPIGISVLINIFFYTTTIKFLNRRQIFGRVRHKLKTNFIMYSLLCLTITISWIFLILSWFQHEGLVYAHIVINAIYAPLIFYICVLRRKHIMFLLKKSCCSKESSMPIDWGNEMNFIENSEY